MDRAMACLARVYIAVLDRDLGGFLDALSSTHRNGIGVRFRRACRARCRISLASATTGSSNEMGSHPSRAIACPLHGSDGRIFSLEFSVAAVPPFGSRDFRSANPATATTLGDWFDGVSSPDCCYNSDVDL